MSLPESLNEFPRELKEIEKRWIFSILPEGKPGYKAFREKISPLRVTGYGVNGEMNFFLGKPGTVPDLTAPTAPVFALGTVRYAECMADIVVHEEFEEMIEVDISVSGTVPAAEEKELESWTYSSWIPGRKAPGDYSLLREVALIPGNIVLAFAVGQKRIWVYEKETGINHFVPVTNYYNELMRIKKIKDAHTALKSSLLFENIEDYTDQELGAAFLIYNKYWRKVKLDYSYFMPQKEGNKGSFFSRFFKRG